MSESKSLSLRGVATKALLLLQKGADREIAICDEEKRAYLMDGEKLGGKAIAMLSDLDNIFDPNKEVLIFHGTTSNGVDISAHGPGFYKIYNYSNAFSLVYWDGLSENTEGVRNNLVYIQAAGVARASADYSQSNIYKIIKIG